MTSKMILYDKHLASRRLPLNVSEFDMPLFEHELCKEINSTTVETLNDIVILCDVLVSFNKYKIYSEYTHLGVISKHSMFKFFLRYFSPPKHIDKAIWITDDWSNGYFHWFADALPRLIACKEFTECKTVVIPSNYKSPFIKESLNILGYDVFFSTKHLRVKELVVSNITAPTGNYNKTLINLLREQLTLPFALNKQKTTRMIYISREKALKRKIINEKEVQSLLKSLVCSFTFLVVINFEKALKTYDIRI